MWIWLVRIILGSTFFAGLWKISEVAFDVQSGELAERVSTGTGQAIRNTTCVATGGIVCPPEAKQTSSSTNTATVTPDVVVAATTGRNTLETITNPWFWLAAGLFVFGATYLVRQTRGLARDVGSGVRSTRDAFKADLSELDMDPDVPTRPAARGGR